MASCLWWRGDFPGDVDPVQVGGHGGLIDDVDPMQAGGHGGLIELRLCGDGGLGPVRCDRDSDLFVSLVSFNIGRDFLSPRYPCNPSLGIPSKILGAGAGGGR